MYWRRFSSPEQKAQVSISDHNFSDHICSVSVVVVFVIAIVVVVVENFSHLLKNHNFDKASLGEGDSSLFK